jgi:hypothetical protein
MMMVVLMMQLFRYFSFDRRMNIVLETVTEAATKLLPIIVVMATVLVMYVVVGMLLFGEMSDGKYQTFLRTQVYCLRVKVINLQPFCPLLSPGYVSFGSAMRSCSLMLLGDFGDNNSLMSLRESTVNIWSAVIYFW